MTERVSPMLAVQAEPFDSDEHLFEVKWNGVRALAAVEAGGWQVWGRELADYAPRYPELELLRGLPAGVLLDGELVVLRDGRSRFDELMRRHQLVSPLKIRQASRCLPATYVAFDLLSAGGRSLAGRPLAERRRQLEELVARRNDPGLVFSAGVVGAGQEFFRQVVEQGHEGVMAKHLKSRYLPGRRSQAWRKIKPFQSLPCVVLGYAPSRQGFHSLLVGAVWQQRLQYVAELSSGFTQEAKRQLAPRLRRLTREQPAVNCPKQAAWVEPQIYCEVRFLERTPGGRLRGAHFRSLIDSPSLPLP
jgi:DNA ligase D-like protein (predicted ligase)